VHEEAENMEHAVSDALIDRIDAYLGHPATDPHGDPIPRPDLSIAAAADRPLSECHPGENFRVARVTDQSPEFLRYLSQAGLEIGAQGSLLSIDRTRDNMTIEIENETKSLPRAAAAKLMVR
jgi:DtxR family Mn-dependent transcriptional regulator